MKKFLYLIALISIWLINVDAGEKTEWYVVFYSDKNTIHRCPRDMYNEYKELLSSENSKKEQLAYMHYQYNESVYYTNNYNYYKNLNYKEQTENFIKYLEIQENINKLQTVNIR